MKEWSCIKFKISFVISCENQSLEFDNLFSQKLPSLGIDRLSVSQSLQNSFKSFWVRLRQYSGKRPHSTSILSNTAANSIRGYETFTLDEHIRWVTDAQMQLFVMELSVKLLELNLTWFIMWTVLKFIDKKRLSQSQQKSKVNIH